MARYFKNIVEDLENKLVSVEPAANRYSFRLTHVGTTCKIRGVKSKYADADTSYVYTTTTDVEVGNVYRFEEQYDSIEILNATGTGQFVIEQEFL